MSESLSDEILNYPNWFGLLVSGESDEEIHERTGIELEAISVARAYLLACEVEKSTKSVEAVFAEYRLRIEGVVREMDGVVRMALDPDRSRGPALKTAGDLLVAKAKIIDQTVARGQDLGVLPRAAMNKNVKVSGGLILAAMPTAELFDETARLRSEGDRLAKQYDQIPFNAMPDPDIYDANVIEAEPVTAVTVPTRVRRKQ